MKLICVYAPANGGSCNSTVCDHRAPHDEGQYPEDGRCQWAKDPHCIPYDPRQAVEEWVSRHFPCDDVTERARELLMIMGEAA